MNLLRPEQIEKLLNDGFKNMLRGSDFMQETETPHYFRMETANRLDFITYPGIKVSNQYFYSIPTLSRYIKPVENYWIDLAPKIGIQIVPHSVTLYFHPAFVNPGIQNEEDYNELYHGYCGVADKEGVSNFFNLAEPLLSNHLFPVAKQYLDLKEIDKFVNTEVKFSPGVQGFLGTTGAVFRRLVIARLVGNPIYDEMVSTYRNGYDWYRNKGKEPGLANWADYPEVYETLFDRLKDVEPLENTVLV